MNDLEYYARNMHKWPGNDANNVIKTLRRNPNDQDVTKDQWLAERARLQNKPSWDDAPEWAKWLCQTSKGYWFFCESNQTPNDEKGWDDIGGIGAMQCMDKGEVLGDWRDTLEPRPEEQTMAVKEWRGPKDGLPPIGTNVRFKTADGFYQEGKTEATCGDWAWVNVDDAEFHTVLLSHLEPLRTEEDRAVEEMVEIIAEEFNKSNDDWAASEDIAKALFQAGYRKQDASE